MYLSNDQITQRPTDQLIGQFGRWVVGSLGRLTSTLDIRHWTFDIGHREQAQPGHFTGGRSETFQPPPSALTRETAAVIRRVRIPTAALWLSRSAFCAV